MPRDVRVGSKASVLVYPRHVRFTPDSDRNADIAGCLKRAKTCREQVQQSLLFDHLVGRKQPLCRNLKAKDLGGLEVDR